MLVRIAPRGRGEQTASRAGEHFVAAELHRRGAYAVTFAGNMPETADPAKTAMRIEALRYYLDENVLRPTGLCCPSHAACRESIREGDPFFEGRLSRTHQYIKVRSPDRAGLIMWCYTDAGGAPTYRRTCDPMAP